MASCCNCENKILEEEWFWITEDDVELAFCSEKCMNQYQLRPEYWPDDEDEYEEDEEFDDEDTDDEDGEDE